MLLIVVLYLPTGWLPSLVFSKVSLIINKLSTHCTTVVCLIMPTLLRGSLTKLELLVELTQSQYHIHTCIRGSYSTCWFIRRRGGDGWNLSTSVLFAMLYIHVFMLKILGRWNQPQEWKIPSLLLTLKKSINPST